MRTRPRTARFQGDPASIAAARRFATDTVGVLDPELCDLVSLVVSELATNAVRHARTAYEIRVETHADRVRVEVSDAGPGWPATGDGAAADDQGRGLRIVDALVHDWGIVPAATSTGKIVWFELPSGGPPAPR